MGKGVRQKRKRIEIRGTASRTDLKKIICIIKLILSQNIILNLIILVKFELRRG